MSRKAVRVEDADQPSAVKGGPPLSWRILPIGILALGTVMFFALGLHRYLSFEELAGHRDALLAWRDGHRAVAVAIFLAAYIGLVALSVPGAIWLTILGGFLFGTVTGTIYAVIGGTVGACAVFLAARYLAHDWLRARAGPAIRRMEAGFREHAMSYLLVLRLLPIFPFWLVNLVPAFLGMRLRTFAIGTLLGVIPGGLVYTLLGSGLGDVIDAGQQPDLTIVFEPQVLAPLIGLSIMAMAPVIYGHLKRGRAARNRDRRVSRPDSLE